MVTPSKGVGLVVSVFFLSFFLFFVFVCTVASQFFAVGTLPFTPHVFWFCLGDGLYRGAIWVQQVLLVAECQSAHIVGVRKSYQSAPFSLRRDFPESCVVPTRARCCLGLLCCPLSSLPSFPGPHQTRAAHFPPQL